ncbi:MAG: hypothetical protein AB7S70_05170 [Hyphomicrobium sp.]|uniref:hypothetical protein n=1 Tax=Hyphomicrobium sp. TaxID=82 RepID=UPI003D09E7E7
MRHVITGLALIAALGAAPAIAKDKKALKQTTTEQSGGAASQENANREMNEDGTFQGKPVVEGPADWSSAAAPGSGAASSGASSGEAGAGSSGMSKELDTR